MTKIWILASVAALGVGALLAWRVWRVHEYSARPRFFFALTLGLAIWVLTAFCLFDGATRRGALVATLALYSPALFVAAWRRRSDRP